MTEHGSCIPIILLFDTSIVSVMTSAIFPSRSEQRRSQLDGNLRQLSSYRHCPPLLIPSSAHGTPVSGPNFGITGRVSDLTPGTAILPSNAPSPRLHPRSTMVFDNAAAADGNEEPVQSKDSFHREHVTFHLFSYSESELKELKMRLISDLERVQATLTRIEKQEIDSVHGLLDPQVNQLSFKTNQKLPDPPTAERRQNGRPTFAVTVNRKINPKIGDQKKVVASIGCRETKQMPTASTTKVKAFDSIMKKCKHILNTLMTQRHGYVFNKPVDVVALKVYDYYDVIKHPMDLGTIRTKLEKKGYQSAQQFAADVRLTFDNAMTYNPKGSQVHNIAESMLSSFERMFKRDLLQYMAPRRKFGALEEKKIFSDGVHRSSPVIVFNSPLSPKEPAPLPRVLQSRTGKTLKPKAKDSNKRKMTEEEIEELRVNLQSMPEKKMEQVYNIVSKRNHNLRQDGNEVEICVADLDNATLWELDRLVSNHLKKEMMKTKETEFHLDEVLLIPEEDPEPKFPGKKPSQELIMENDRRGDSGEEYVDIGEDAPLNEFPPMEIERDPDDADTGSSNSSSDGSSSTDSDSDSSSSESDSDNVNVESAKVYY